MKNSVIKDLFYGNGGYNEIIKNPKQKSKRLDKIIELEEELKNRLTPEQFKLHESFVDLIDKDSCDEADFYFVEGFKLGLLIGFECFDDI